MTRCDIELHRAHSCFCAAAPFSIHSSAVIDATAGFSTHSRFVLRRSPAGEAEVPAMSKIEAQDVVKEL